MALKPCRECKKEVSTEASVEPAGPKVLPLQSVMTLSGNQRPKARSKK